MTTQGLERLSAEDVKAVYINQTTGQIISAYLEYSGKLIEAVMNRQSLSGAEFKEIDDDLIIKPYELIDLIDEVQKALRATDD